MRRFQDLLRTAAEGDPQGQIPGQPQGQIPGQPQGQPLAPETTLVTTDPEFEIPQGATEIPARLFITDEGITVVPETPLEIQGQPEPVTVLDIEIHDELPGQPAQPAPMELTQVPSGDQGQHAVETGLSEEEVITSMKGLNDENCTIAMFRAGTESDPAWLVVKDGEPIARISYSAIGDESLHAFIASDKFPSQVHSNARVNGWEKVLPMLKAKMYTNKGVTAATKPVDIEALKDEVRSEVFNAAHVAYAAMRGGARQHPLMVTLFDAVAKAGMPQPEVFTAEVLKDAEGAFLNALFDVTAEVHKMSPQVRDEFKAMIARTNIPMLTASYKGDEALRARLASSSLPLAPAVETSTPGQSVGLFR